MSKATREPLMGAYEKARITRRRLGVAYFQAPGKGWATVSIIGKTKRAGGRGSILAKVNVPVDVVLLIKFDRSRRSS